VRCGGLQKRASDEWGQLENYNRRRSVSRELAIWIKVLNFFFLQNPPSNYPRLSLAVCLSVRLSVYRIVKTLAKFAIIYKTDPLRQNMTKDRLSSVTHHQYFKL